jgi:CDP-diacylglycerol---serine O-phosphatidyltransferase
MTTRPPEIEPLSNRLVVHRASTALLPAGIRLGIHPNAVTAAGLLFGLAAAACYSQWTDWRFATAGFLLMVGWHVMDGLDGQLARATGSSSDLGRLLDGVADYSTFVAVYLVLAFTHPHPGLALALALTAGLAHALQAQFYEGERATYIRRRNGRFAAVPRPETGGLAERLYNRGEALLGNRARPFDARLQAVSPAERAGLLAAWQPRAARALRLAGLLSANSRTIAIWLAVLAGEPMLFWLWEIAILTLVALAAGRALRQAEEPASGGNGPDRQIAGQES